VRQQLFRRADFCGLGVGLRCHQQVARRLNRAVAIEDTRQRFELSYSYELPFGTGRRLLSGNGFLNRFASGWELNAIYTAQIGTPMTLDNVTSTSGNCTSVTDVYGTFNSNSFPDNNGQSAVLSGSRYARLNQWFNTSVFSHPPAFTYPNTGRTITSVRGDEANNLDLGDFKNNSLREGRYNLQLRGEFFNVANHVRFGLPGLAYGNATCGVVSTQWNTPRQIQVAAKFIF
jgi:hypothetical protein